MASENAEAGQVIWRQISFWTKAACGAREALVSNEAPELRFKVDRRPYRYVRVLLDRGSDLYEVEYFRVRRSDYVKISLESASGVFAEDLSDVIYGMVNK